MVDKKNIAISLLTCNEYTMLKPCIDSLINSDLKNHNFKLFHYDNNSKDKGNNYINSLNIPTSQFISNENKGIVIPRIEVYNNIVEEGGFDFLLEIHPDMLFPEVWLEPLLKIDNPQTLILQPHIYTRRKFMTLDEFEKYIKDNTKDEIIYNKCRQVHPWLIKLDLVNSIGGYYDTIFSPQRYEDDDFVYRVLKNNYLIRSTNKSNVYHQGEATRHKLLGNKGADHGNKFLKKHGLKSKQTFIEMFEIHPAIRL
jgi:hypothetical protein